MHCDVSVIIPVYNAEKYIVKQLMSIMNQSLKNIQIIIVNDGSTDNTRMIIEELSKGDNRIVLINQENKRQGSARNNGFKVATGDYVIFLDADDWIEKEFLEKMYEKAEMKNLDIVICDAIWEKNNKEVRRSIHSIDCNSLYSGKILLQQLIENKALVAPWNKLIRKQLIKDNNILFPEKLFYEDLEFTFKLFYYANRIGKESTVYYHYQITEGSATKQYNMSVFDSICVLGNILEFLKKENVYQTYREQYQALYMYHGVYSMILKMNYAKDKDIYDTVTKKIKELFNQNFINGWIKNKYMRIDKKIVILVWRINPKMIKILKKFIIT